MKSRLSFAIAAALFACANPSDAAALIDDALEQRLNAAGPHRVVVTFSDTADLTRLLAIYPGALVMKQLPMAGALLTTAQVRTVASWDGVESIYHDAPLSYFNHQAAEITGGHAVHDGVGLRGNGVTIAVLDSGIDANHPDLPLGSKTVQNVKLVGDLGLAGVQGALENQANTDTSSGHGTHVAGTVAGTGQASANDPRRGNYYDGIAPQASLIGIGAGEGISILHSLQGFDWVLANQQRYGIDILTNSWGSSVSVYDPNNPINRASYEAYKRGIVVTFAAGNDGPAEDTLNPYAIVPWVVNVGSGTKTRALSDFSSRGIEGDAYKHIDLVAPGSSICSTRAAGTAIGATGPLVDSTNPAYYAYYHCISGTSMATPFVAGTAALLLEANPALSPDQIEQILVDTADPMPEWPYHVVGGGYINVARAVERAASTVGERQAFLGGVTAWSSQGAWNTVADNDALLLYVGKWSSMAGGGSDGSSRVATVGKKDAPGLHLSFEGRAMQIAYPRDARGGLADVYVDGVKHGRVSFYNASSDFAGRFPITGLSSGLHRVELRGVQGRIYVDGLLTDGDLVPTGTTLVEETQTFTGTMGPSAADVMVHEFPIEVGSDVSTLRAKLGWSGGVDLDLHLVDPNGQTVASGATLGNPETLEFNVTTAGTYTYRVTGYVSLLAPYTLTSTQLRRVLAN